MVSRITYNTFIIMPGNISTISQFFRASRCCKTIILTEGSVTSDLIKPIRRCSIIQCSSLIGKIFLQSRTELICRKKFRLSCNTLSSPITGKLNQRVSGLSFTGSDKNNAVGTTGTIDSSRRTIFQYINGFNIIGIQVGKISTFNSVNHNQRPRSSFHRSQTTQLNFKSPGRIRSVRTGNVQSCNLPL